MLISLLTLCAIAFAKPVAEDEGANSVGEAQQVQPVQEEDNQLINDLHHQSVQNPEFEAANYAGAVDARYLASLGGEMPPYMPTYPVIDHGYLVPVWVDDENSELLSEDYDWVDPGPESISWSEYLKSVQAAQKGRV